VGIRFGRAPSYGEIEKHYVILHDGAVTYYYFFVMGMKGESVNHALHVAFQTSGWLHLEAFASPTVFCGMDERGRQRQRHRRRAKHTLTTEVSHK